MSRVSHGKCGKSDNGIPCGCHTFYPTDDNTNICSCCTHHKGYHAPPGTEPAPQSLFASGGSQYSGLAASGTTAVQQTVPTNGMFRSGFAMGKRPSSIATTNQELRSIFGAGGGFDPMVAFAQNGGQPPKKKKKNFGGSYPLNIGTLGFIEQFGQFGGQAHIAQVAVPQDENYVFKELIAILEKARFLADLEEGMANAEQATFRDSLSSSYCLLNSLM